VEAARQLAVRVHKPDGSVARAIADAYALLLAREPTSQESQLWTRAHQRHLAAFSADPESAQRLLAVGASRETGHMSAPELAAYTNVFLSLLNLDETLNKE
jgi:hypothetical protein